METLYLRKIPNCKKKENNFANPKNISNFANLLEV